MKIRYDYFFWTIPLMLVLMVLIYLAQLLSQQNISRLNRGNQEAAITFTVRNSLQEIVNITLTLEERFSRNQVSRPSIPALQDTLTMIGYNSSMLSKLNLGEETNRRIGQMNQLVEKQIDIYTKLLSSVEEGNKSKYSLYLDSLEKLKSGSTIFSTAVETSKQLEKKLQGTLSQNMESSRNLSSFSKTLALIAIAAIVILGTIIINRHRKQQQLIKALENAHRQVIKSSRVKEEFLANMSHEIRTPLNAINGFSGLLSETNLDSSQEQYVGIIQNSTNNLMQIVNDVLDISSIEAGKLTINKSSFSLTEVIQSVWWMFRPEAEQKKLHFERIVDESTPVNLVGDKERFVQILNNLVSNAIKSTMNGFVKIIVEHNTISDRLIWLQVKVADSGVGIKADEVGKIFERFYQVSSDEFINKKGTGLGLAIVKNLVELMGGKINAESKLGEGSVFTVTLPFEISQEHEATTVKKVKLQSERPQFRNARVLVAEDNMVNQELVRLLLNKYAIQPVFCANGLEAIILLQKEKFDLLLLDIQMPVMGGLETIAKVKELHIKTPVVAMTAFVMPGEKEKCLAAGMQGYIAKPINEKAMETHLVQLLGQRAEIYAVKSELPGYNFLLEMMAGDEEKIAGILDIMKSQLKRDARQLKTLIQQKGEAHQFSSIAHHLVSTLSPLGEETDAIKKAIQLENEAKIGKDAPVVLGIANELHTDIIKILNSFEIS